MIQSVTKFSDNKVFLNTENINESGNQLFPGIYNFEYDQYDLFKNFKSISVPNVYSLIPSLEIENIKQYVDIIFSKKYEDFCTNSNILIKNGILLYGKQGIGKSNYINYILNKAIKEKNACIFNISGRKDLINATRISKNLRDIQNNLFVFLIEELDQLMVDSNEGYLKNFMDGINSINNCLFLSTTNYLEKIPKSLTERPSRFKKVYKIEPHPDVEVMKEWLVSVYKTFDSTITNEKCEYLHDLCINKTIDEIKHIIIDYNMSISDFDKPTNNKFGLRRNT